MIIAFFILGVLGLPFSYIAIPIAISYGVPSGLPEMIGTAIVWIIGLIGPLLLLIGLGSYQQRRQAIQGAISNGPDKQ